MKNFLMHSNYRLGCLYARLVFSQYAFSPQLWGLYRLVPEDIVTDIQAEGIDVAVPLLANLQNRFLEQYLWG